MEELFHGIEGKVWEFFVEKDWLFCIKFISGGGGGMKGKNKGFWEFSFEWAIW